MVANLLQPAVVDPAWLHYVQVLGAPGVAIVAAFIAWRIQRQQVAIAKGALKTADNKLRLDLFDKRLAIFDAATKLLIHVHTHEVLSVDKVMEFLNATRGTKWLFNQAAQDFVDEMYRRVQIVHQLDGLQRPNESAENYTKRLMQLKDAREDFLKMAGGADAIVDPFMSINH